MFKKKESYKHRAAIDILSGWLEEWFKVRHEVEFYIDGSIAFVPDITCYEDKEIVAFYEVHHTHEMDYKKLGRMYEWTYRNQSQAGIYEISAEWILVQTEKPDKLQLVDMSILI